MARTPDRTISYPPGDPIKVVTPMVLDPYQKIVNVKWQESISGPGPSHVGLLLQLSLIPSFTWGSSPGSGDLDWASYPNQFVWYCGIQQKYLYYEDSGIWAPLGGDAFVTISNYNVNRFSDASGIPVNNFGAGSFGIHYNHSASLEGYSGDIGIGPLFRVNSGSGDFVPGPSPMTRVTQLRAGHAEGFYSRGPGGAVLDTWQPTAGSTISYGGPDGGGQVGTILGHVVNRPYNHFTFSRFNNSDGNLEATGLTWPDDHWDSIAWEVYILS